MRQTLVCLNRRDEMYMVQKWHLCLVDFHGIKEQASKCEDQLLTWTDNLYEIISAQYI